MLKVIQVLTIILMVVLGVTVASPESSMAQVISPAVLSAESFIHSASQVNLLPPIAQPFSTSGSLVASRPVPRRSGGWEAFLRSIGLGRRGSCSNIDPPLISLIPPVNSGFLDEDLEIGATSTTEGHPTFWFYIPPQLTKENHLGQFMIQDSDGSELLNGGKPISINLGSITSGVAGFTLPVEQKGLVVGHRYYWYFSAICDVRRPSRNVYVEGAIERVAPPPEIDKAKSDEALLDIYADNNIWNETLTLTAELLCKNPSDKELKSYLGSLLQLADKKLRNPELGEEENRKRIQAVKTLYCSPDTHQPQKLQAL